MILLIILQVVMILLVTDSPHPKVAKVETAYNYKTTARISLLTVYLFPVSKKNFTLIDHFFVEGMVRTFCGGGGGKYIATATFT